MGDLYAVVEFNQASGQPDDTANIHDNLDDAVQDAAERTAETAVVGRREKYRVYRLEKINEED